MVYFLGFLTLFWVWCICRVTFGKRTTVWQQIIVYAAFMLMTIASATGTLLAWLAERHQL